MRIAVTGYKGRLGSELVRRGCIPITSDITDPIRLPMELTETQPYPYKYDAIINCAAFTDVSACESDEGYKKALHSNYYGVKNLRYAFNGKIIHISTDYVFDGKKGPYSENSSLTAAVNAYGLTKQGAEILLRAFPFPYSIVRTTCLYDTYIQEDFVSATLGGLKFDGFRATTKLSGNPTYVPHLAEAIMKLIELPKLPEIIHLVGREVLTRYEFALMIANVFGYDKKFVMPTNELFGAGNRPAKGGLKTKLAEKLGLPIYSVVEGLKQYKEDLKNVSNM